MESPLDTRSPLGYLQVPDLLADWPWQRKVNPLCEEVSEEGNLWFRSFVPFNPKSQHAFERGMFGLCAALMVPDAPRDQLRTCVDALNIAFLVDEYTDVEPAPKVRMIIDACVDALHDPGKPRPEGETIVGEVVRQYVNHFSGHRHVHVLYESHQTTMFRFWERGQKTATPQGAKHFLTGFIAYLQSVTTEAEARDSGAVLTTDAYLAIRRDNIGVRFLCPMVELQLSIPDALYGHPLLKRMMELDCDLVIIDNDVVSYNREQATGVGDFNIVTTTAHHNGLSLEDTVRFLAERVVDLEKEFWERHREFCAFLDGVGGPDKTAEIRKFVDQMGNVRRAAWCWSFDGHRYFGERGPVYAKTQMVPLIPKRMQDKSARGNKVDVLLMEEELAKL
uniref:Terpene synthase n=1 Tax=Ganoderma boninense TaxID=34458 RepID=A0A5K1K6B3_9APHY|nr:N/A [Ganoderma boninense]